MEWGTAAGHATARAVGEGGGAYLTDEKKPLHYDKDNLPSPVVYRQLAERGGTLMSLFRYFYQINACFIK